MRKRIAGNYVPVRQKAQPMAILAKSCACLFCPPFSYYSLLLQDDECELNNLCVIPSYRHQGIGETLLRNAFQVAMDLHCNKMNIGIVEENLVLKRWYESFGFVHTGTHKFDFFPFTCGYMEKSLC